MLCTYVAILFLVIYQIIATNAVSEEHNSDALGMTLDVKNGDENQSITPKSLWGNKRSRSKAKKSDSSFTAISDLVRQELKVNKSRKKPFKRSRIKVKRNEQQLKRHREDMRIYREKIRSDPKREEEFKRKVSKQKREKLIKIQKNPIELANHKERRKEVNKRYRQNKKAKNDAANILSSLKTSLP